MVAMPAVEGLPTPRPSPAIRLCRQSALRAAQDGHVFVVEANKSDGLSVAVKSPRPLVDNDSVVPAEEHRFGGCYRAFERGRHLAMPRRSQNDHFHKVDG